MKIIGRTTHRVAQHKPADTNITDRNFKHAEIMYYKIKEFSQNFTKY